MNKFPTTKLVSFVLVGLLVALLGLLALYAYVAVQLFGIPADVGSAGDMFGGANALFSALALGAVLLTIYLQRRSLEIQRDDLEATQEELRATNRTHQEHLRHLEDAERRRLTLALAEFLSTEHMVLSRRTVRRWTHDVKALPPNQHLDLDQLGSVQLAAFIEFACRTNAMATAGLLDRGLAFGLFGRETINLIYELDGCHAALRRIRPDWDPDIRPQLIALRTYLQSPTQESAGAA